jgi:PAS domain S-box-containing protein
MCSKEILPGEDRLAAYTDAFESFSRTIETLEKSYADLESRFSALNEQLEETNIKLNHALLQEEEARSFLNNILSSVSSSILVYDRQGGISHCNLAAERMFGLKSGNIVGRIGADIILSDNRPEVCAARTLQSGTEYSSEEKVIRMNSGAEVPVAVSTALMRSSNGEVIGAVEVFHDLTKMRKLEDEISRVKALAALGEMAATIAHEVRNPLGGIAGFASLLKRDLSADHPAQRLADKIIAGVDNLNRSVTSLLTYAREINLAVREVDIAPFLSEIVTYFKADINHDVGIYSIKLDVTPDELRWRIDPEQLRQAVSNLLHNAIQAMPAGGSISLLAFAENELTIQVSDSGGGIDENILPQLFTPFFTTKLGGTGLGLATVKKIVEAHRGRVEVRTSLGEGTTFTLVIPR